MISLFDIKRILTPEKSTMPSDDFRIIQSWAEYDETSGKNPENKNLNYLCYELEVMNPDTGERIHLFKAIKFARVIRLPANAKQSTAFMNMQQQILAGVYENNYDFITQDDGNGIKPRASSTVLNGYYWETYYNSIRSKVFVYAQVTYNANTGAYMSRTKALGKFSVKGSNTSACGVDQSLSSATVYKSASVPYVNYHPAAFIKYKDGTYRYMKDWKFNVKCYSNAQPKPYM